MTRLMKSRELFVGGRRMMMAINARVRAHRRKACRTESPVVTLVFVCSSYQHRGCITRLSHLALLRQRFSVLESPGIVNEIALSWSLALPLSRQLPYLRCRLPAAFPTHRVPQSAIRNPKFSSIPLSSSLSVSACSAVTSTSGGRTFAHAGSFV